jgi:recombination protein RecT
MPAQAQSTAVTTIEPRQTGIVADVRKMERQFALALPEHVSPEKFVRVVATAISSNPDLQKADRESVLSAAMKCAQDGLLPDGREAALVTYGNKAQYLPMIAGVLVKVRRSGELLTIGAHVVYEKDVFTYVLGDEERIEHKPYLDGPRGKAIAVYAVAKTKDGGVYREVMSLEQVSQVRNVSRAKNNGPWVQWWDEMARKTVLRRLAKRLPMSTDLQQVFQRDDDHYDLSRQAAGAATMRRLHADFDEPADAELAAVVIDAPPQSETVTAEAEIIERDLEAVDDTREEDMFPGDKTSTFAPEEEFDLEGWAREMIADDGTIFRTVADIQALFHDKEACARFERLKRESPSIAKQLEAALKGREKALADKERVR